MLGVHELSVIALQTLLAAGASLQMPQRQPTVAVSGGVQLETGASGELSLTLLETPAAGFPLSVVIDRSPLDLRYRRLSWMDVVDPLALRPRVSAPFHAPPTAGTFAVRALVTYVTCDAQRCRTRHVRVRWIVVVRDPQAGAVDGTG